MRQAWLWGATAILGRHQRAGPGAARERFRIIAFGANPDDCDQRRAERGQVGPPRATT